MSHLVLIEHLFQDFNADMQSFFHLFTRYMEGGAASELLYSISLECSLAIISHTFSHGRDWERVNPPPGDQILSYDQLPVPANVGNLAKLAVLKVNGGLGTSMG
jgi:UTP--glucose-1-phosphate uridylyltransferase